MRPRIYSLAVASISIFLPLLNIASAGEWDKNASVNLGSYYSTNICLVNSNIAEEEGKAVGTFRPQVAVNGGGARSRLALSAAVEYNSLADSSVECNQGPVFGSENREAWVPRVNGLGELEVIEDWVTLYGTAFAAQNPINPFLSGGDDNANALGNTNITYQWGGGLRVDRNLPDNWRLLANIAYNQQYNAVNQLIGDSSEQRGSFDLGKDPFAARLSFGVRGFYSEIDFEETELQPAFTNRLARAEIYAGLLVSDALVLQGLVGEEDNVLLSADEEIDGSYWDLGFTWRPISRVNVSAGYGERFFGPTPRLRVNYSHKRSAIQFSYSVNVQFPRNIRAQAQGEPGSAPDDAAEAGGAGDVLGSDGLPTFIGNSPVENTLTELSYSLDGRRTSLRLTARSSEQRQLSTSQNAEFIGADLYLSRTLFRSSRAFFALRWVNSERLDNGGAGLSSGGLERWSTTVGLSRRLARNTRISFRYTYQDQRSDNLVSNNFVDHRVALNITKTF
jgi:uncharacterized protein (PEP-CTERM system associated)